MAIKYFKIWQMKELKLFIFIFILIIVCNLVATVLTA